jgi:hypothetical protein
MSDEQIAKEGVETFGTFLGSLEGPNDIYKQIVLEEFFRLIFEIYFGEKN